MEMQQLTGQARDLIDVHRVYGEPVERDGVTVIPAAIVRGGGGAGEGTQEGQQGSGGGFGITARPAGAWILHGGRAKWRPALDVGRLVLGGQIVALLALVVVRGLLRSRWQRPRWFRPYVKA